MDSPHSSRPTMPRWVRRAARGVVRWRFFLGACFLTGTFLIPRAGVAPVVAGFVLAGVVRFACLRLRRAFAGGRGTDG